MTNSNNNELMIQHRETIKKNLLGLIPEEVQNEFAVFLEEICITKKPNIFGLLLAVIIDTCPRSHLYSSSF